MASSIDLIRTTGELVGLQCGRETAFKVGQNQSFKALGDDEGECYWLEIVEASNSCLFQYRYDGCGFEASRNNSQGQ